MNFNVDMFILCLTKSDNLLMLHQGGENVREIYVIKFGLKRSGSGS